jgi:hypothetical protein
VRTTGSLVLLLLLLSGVAVSQTVPPKPEEIRIPAAGRPTPFYDAVGKSVTVSAEAEPRTVVANQSMIYTLRIQGLRTPSQMKRPELANHEAFSRDFEIDDLDPVPDEPAGTRVFRYRLRPRRGDLTEIPRFELSFFDPERVAPPSMPGFSFRKVRSDAIAFTQTVEKTTPPVLPPVPLEIPEFARHVGRSTGIALPSGILLPAIAGPPLLALIAYGIWKFRNPGAARLAKRRRTRAARNALAALRSVGDERSLARTLTAYLAERFAITPDDFANSPGNSGGRLPEPIAADTALWFRRIDACRYGSGHMDRPTLARDAIAIVEYCEALS